ncbi:MAG: hypothetical protein JWQ25_2625 [Daejeonella sp.]|nr:hypothetical protein [Daejeonella sp.]
MSETTNSPFWDFKKYGEAQWFKTLGVGLLYMVVIYFILHALFSISDHYGRTKLKLDYEDATLSTDQKQLINRIYFDTTQKASPVADSMVVEVTPAPEKDTLKNSTAATDPNTPKPGKSNNAPKAPNGSTKKVFKKQLVSNPGSPNFKLTKAIRLINNEFNNKIDPVQLDSIKNYLASATDLEATAYLADARFQVKSYFWLTGPAVYFEIIFWSIFGVISSLLFSLGLIGKNSTTIPNDPSTEFDSSEIPYQFAKILYAPICTLVIVLGYNFFNDTNMADISSGKGVIVFAFIGGFYSSRVIALLDRLKEVVLPGDANSTAPKSSKTLGGNSADTTETYSPQIDPPPPPPDEKEITEDAQDEAEVAPDPNAVTLPGDANTTTSGTNQQTEIPILAGKKDDYDPEIDAPPPMPDEKDITEIEQEETEIDLDSNKPIILGETTASSDATTEAPTGTVTGPTDVLTPQADTPLASTGEEDIPDDGEENPPVDSDPNKPTV